MDLRCQRVGELAFAPQPTEDELKLLPGQFAAVLNLRSRKEDGFLADEEAIVTGLGLKYANIEWLNANDITPEMASQIFAEIDQLPKPLFVHCNVGFTAAYAVLVKVCAENKCSGLDCLKLGMDVGFDFTSFSNMYRILMDSL